jgi:hypothetical protein
MCHAAKCRLTAVRLSDTFDQILCHVTDFCSCRRRLCNDAGVFMNRGNCWRHYMVLNGRDRGTPYTVCKPGMEACNTVADNCAGACQAAR